MMLLPFSNEKDATHDIMLLWFAEPMFTRFFFLQNAEHKLPWGEILELLTLRHNNVSPHNDSLKLKPFDNNSPQLNNESTQFFSYDYILIILILTISMIKYDIHVSNNTYHTKADI